MGQIEKTVFICYRRTNLAWALAIYQDLTSHGYDVFFDFTSIDSGDFEQIILENVRSRAHFLVLLTPSALERCGNPGDWMRQEIETAIASHRNIVPLMFEGFNFGAPAVEKYLTGKLTTLSRYNAVRVYGEYFDDAMRRLRERFLDIPLDSVRHPISDLAVEAAEDQKRAAARAPRVREQQLEAQEWFERGNKESDPSEKIYHYTGAVRLDPGYADAFNNRGVAYFETGDFNYAIRDFTQALRLDPNFVSACVNRGIAYYDQYLRKYSREQEDEDPNEVFRQAFRLESDNAYDAGNTDDADETNDSGERIEVLESAIHDFSEAIRLDPGYSEVYFFRAEVLAEKSDFDGAIADLQKYLDLGVNFRIADPTKVEALMRSFRDNISAKTGTSQEA